MHGLFIRKFKVPEVAIDYLDVFFRPEEIEFVEKIDKNIFDENDNRPVYLNYCDCRSMKGDCNLPTRTCITYENGINTRTHRGISEEINKEKAKQIVIEAHKAGLMHTANESGICNCCGDCCYIFRSQQKINSIGIWPPSKYIVDFDESECVGCGKYAKRCHFGVFEVKDHKVIIDESKCVGCGICNSTCKAKALTMKERK